MSRKATIHLFKGDDYETMADLRREIAIAEHRLEFEETVAEHMAAAPSRMGDDVPATALPAEVVEARQAVTAAETKFKEFVDEARGRAEAWVLEPIGNEEWRALVLKHPARSATSEDGTEVPDPRDVDFGFNTDTLPKELLLFVDEEDPEFRTVQDPFENPAALRRRVRRLAEGEFNTLWMAAYALNTARVIDPKAVLYSTDPRSSET